MDWDKLQDRFGIVGEKVGKGIRSVFGDRNERMVRGLEPLVEAINGGSEAAFETLYLRYRDWVTGLAARMCGDRDDALDVLQETFSYVLGKFPGFELRARFTTFLYPVVKNLSIAARRKRHRLTTRPAVGR